MRTKSLISVIITISTASIFLVNATLPDGDLKLFRVHTRRNGMQSAHSNVLKSEGVRTLPREPSELQIQARIEPKKKEFQACTKEAYGVPELLEYEDDPILHGAFQGRQFADRIRPTVEFVKVPIDGKDYKLEHWEVGGKDWNWFNRSCVEYVSSELQSFQAKGLPDNFQVDIYPFVRGAKWLCTSQLHYFLMSCSAFAHPPIDPPWKSSQVHWLRGDKDFTHENIKWVKDIQKIKLVYNTFDTEKLRNEFEKASFNLDKSTSVNSRPSLPHSQNIQ